MRNRLLPTFLIGILLILSTKTNLLAFQNDRELIIHGFASQGFLKSTNNNFLGKTSDGTFDFNEVGINLAMQLTDELRFGIQIFSRDLGYYDDNDLGVDWAFLDYSLYDWLGFRAGKIKMPFGLYNRQRDADMMRTSILLPQSVYPEGIRAWIVSFQGGSVYGSYLFGSAGEINYELFGGTINFDGNQLFLRNAFQIIGLDLEASGFNYQALLEEMGIDLNDITANTSHIEGGYFMWNTPIAGLRLGFSIMHGKGDLESGEYKADFTLEKFNIFSAEYEIGNMVFMAEHIAATFDLDIDVQSYSADKEIKLLGWYAGGSCRITHWLELGATYGIYYPNADDKKGNIFESAGKKDYYAWQKDAALSAKFNLNDYMSLKVETHFMDGVGLCDLSNNPEIMEKNWMLYALKIGISF